MRTKFLFLVLAVSCLAGCSTGGNDSAGNSGNSNSSLSGRTVDISANLSGDPLLSENSFFVKNNDYYLYREYSEGVKWKDIKNDFNIKINMDTTDYHWTEFVRKYGFEPIKNPQVAFFIAEHRYTGESGTFVLEDNYVINDSLSIMPVYSCEKAISAGDGVWSTEEKINYVRIPVDYGIDLNKYIKDKPTLVNCKFDQFKVDNKYLEEELVAVTPTSYVDAAYITPLCLSSSSAFEVAFSGTYDEDSFPNLFYTKDISSETSWEEVTCNTYIQVDAGGRIYFKGDGLKPASGILDFQYSQYRTPYSYHFMIGDNYRGQHTTYNYGQVTISGDLSSLMDYKTSNYDACYFGLFSGNSALGDASHLILPDKKMADAYYMNLFSGCSSLTKAPTIKATTLAKYCFMNMFSNTAIMEAPELPATTLADYCYMGMFQNCSGLMAAPELPATQLKPYCYAYMFQNCTSLSTMRVGFTEWTVETDNSTFLWISGAGGATGRFYCPSSLERITGTNYIPVSWVIVKE